MTRLPLVLGIAFALSSLTTPDARAQTEADGSDDRIEEVVVKGQKIERSLQDTRESVAVFDQDFIIEQRLFDLRDIFNQTANAFELFNGEDFGIRGVSASSASTGGGSGELGSLFIDGVAFTGFARRFGPRALWDIEQVEILRGPQSTNVGRNALIGAVVMTSRAPDPSGFDSAVRLEAGNNGRLGFEGMVNVPVSDTSALRFTAETFETDGYVTNTTIPDDSYDARDNQTFRGRYLANPTDRLSVDIIAQYGETKRGQQIYRADLIDDIEDRISSSNLPAREDFEALSGSVKIGYDFSDTLSFESITAFLDGEYDRFDDDDEGPDGGDSFRARDLTEENWSQEFRLTMEQGRWSGVAGIWLTEIDVVNNTRGRVNLAISDFPIPPSLQVFYPPTVGVDAFIPSETERFNAAFFTEWDYAVNDRWTLNLGFRYDYEEQDNLQNSLNSLAPGTELPDPVQAGMLSEMLAPGSGPAVEAGVAQINGFLQSLLTPTDNPAESTDYDAFLPQIGATYDVSDDVSLSAFYKRGYRAGGTGIALTGEVVEFEPEYIDNFEVSLRSVWLDGDLVVNANAYFGDWEDQQVASCPQGPLSCVTINAGESEIYGLELEGRYAINENASMYVSVGLSETEFTNFFDDLSGQDLSGNEFALSPNVTSAIGGQVFLTDRFSISGSLTYQGQSFADIQNTPGTELDSRTLLNLNALYQLENIDIALYGRNLTDEFYLVSDFISGDGTRLVTSGPPREYGLQVSFAF
ncbi:MAG: TonB-dependent receptor [Pseudomonadota bacterium]